MLIDQGTADQFLAEQLKPELLATACEAADPPLQLRIQPDYDYSYFFITGFIENYIAFHSCFLQTEK